MMLAILIAAQLAPGCRQLDRALVCELAPPATIAVPAAPAPATSGTAPPPSPPRSPSHHDRRRPVRRHRAAARPDPKPRPAPTPAELVRKVDALVKISDCTGARTLLTSTGGATAAADTYRACLGLPPTTLTGLDAGAMPGEAPSVRAAPAPAGRPH